VRTCARPWSIDDLQHAIVDVEHVERRAAVDAQRGRAESHLGASRRCPPTAVADGQRPVDEGLAPFVGQAGGRQRHRARDVVEARGARRRVGPGGGRG
jgi:hypothetical protein